ncbi:uncharacterized protein BXIN_0641 [Babesia sp. Xinjiang]|uniref:uncharacterized protein n=1 Tax=Babesia sp. Xinjiang TaxID=462227 RepID=UPI000A24E0A9|nr:uncharacterized protein BXIN_0641 [Babesia sp. Xinjiang]ORM41867.1 hypothetical protein BXIN_0641 [Babesia sp. Xinjiang]
MRVKISQFCARNGLCSRNEAKKLIQSGQLKLNGVVIRADSTVRGTLHPSSITFNARARFSEANKVSVMLHKPESYLSTFSRRTDVWSKSLLIPENRCENDIQNHLNPSKLRRLVPINPLEYGASGLTLFSEDVTLISRFSDCEEEYHVIFRDRLTEPKVYVLSCELHIDGVAIPRLKIAPLSDYSAQISIQGASSKLRKACRQAGLEIRSLKRLRLGQLELGDLLCGMLRLSTALSGSRQHGWRFERLRPTVKRYVRINHPPQLRSPLLKLEGDSNKLLYVCNGRVSREHIATFESSARHFIKKGDIIETPVLAIVKGGSHILLETLSMDDIDEFEKLVPEIRKAFDGGCLKSKLNISVISQMAPNRPRDVASDLLSALYPL